MYYATVGGDLGPVHPLQSATSAGHIIKLTYPKARVRQILITIK